MLLSMNKENPIEGRRSIRKHRSDKGKKHNFTQDTPFWRYLQRCNGQGVKPLLDEFGYKATIARPCQHCGEKGKSVPSIGGGAYPVCPLCYRAEEAIGVEGYKGIVGRIALKAAGAIHPEVAPNRPDEWGRVIEPVYD